MVVTWSFDDISTGGMSMERNERFSNMEAIGSMNVRGHLGGSAMMRLYAFDVKGIKVSTRELPFHYKSCRTTRAAAAPYATYGENLIGGLRADKYEWINSNEYCR